MTNITIPTLETLENFGLFKGHPVFSAKGDMEAYLEDLRDARHELLHKYDSNRNKGYFPLGFKSAQDAKSGSAPQACRYLAWSYAERSISIIYSNMSKQDAKTFLSREWCLLFYPEYRAHRGDGVFYEATQNGFDLNAVLDDVQEFCANKGQVDLQRLFKSGVYPMPEAGVKKGLGELVVNTGASVLNERGEEIPPMIGDCIFERDADWWSGDPFQTREEFSAADSDAILSLIGSFGLSDPSDARLAYGWLLNSYYGKASPRHPHIFLTGPRGGGKTTLMRLLNALSFEDAQKTLLDATTTPAGLLQYLKGRPFPVFLDEFEQAASNMRASETLDSMCGILTASYGGMNRKRGSSDGVEKSYECHSPFMCAAINPPPPKAGLSTRSIFISFRHQDAKKDLLRRSKINLDELIGEGNGAGMSRGVLREIGSRMRRHMLRLYPVFSRNFYTTRAVLKKEGHEDRFADTVSIIVSSEMTCRLARELSEPEVVAELMKVNYEKLAERMVSDESNALSRLLSAEVSGCTDGAFIEDTLGGALARWIDSDEKSRKKVNDILGCYHARLIQDDGGVWLAASYSMVSGGGRTAYDASFSKLLSGTPWEFTYRDSFMNLLTNEQRSNADFVKKRMSFGGVIYYCILIRMPVGIGYPEEPLAIPAIIDRSVHIPPVSLFDKFYDNVVKYLADRELEQMFS